MSNQITEIKTALKKMEPEFKASLPAHIPADRFVRAAQTAVSNVSGLDQADRNSVYNACCKAAEDGLVIDGREAAIVVYSTKTPDGKFIKKAQYIPMVAGMMKKARQSGQISTLTAQIVYSNDPFSFNPAMDDVPNHSPDWFGERGEPKGCYAVARLKDGSTVVEIMSKADIEKIRQKSRAKDSGPWVTDTGEMWRKTVIKRICKYLPSSTDLDAIIDQDDKEYRDDDEPEVTTYDGNTGEVISKPAPAKRTTAAKVLEQEPVEITPPPAAAQDIIEAEYIVEEMPI